MDSHYAAGGQLRLAAKRPQTSFPRTSQPLIQSPAEDVTVRNTSMNAMAVFLWILLRCSQYSASGVRRRPANWRRDGLETGNKIGMEGWKCRASARRIEGGKERGL